VSIAGQRGWESLQKNAVFTFTFQLSVQVGGGGGRSEKKKKREGGYKDKNERQLQRKVQFSLKGV